MEVGIYYHLFWGGNFKYPASKILRFSGSWVYLCPWVSPIKRGFYLKPPYWLPSFQHLSGVRPGKQEPASCTCTLIPVATGTHCHHTSILSRSWRAGVQHSSRWGRPRCQQGCAPSGTQWRAFGETHFLTFASFQKPPSVFGGGSSVFKASNGRMNFAHTASF